MTRGSRAASDIAEQADVLSSVVSTNASEFSAARELLNGCRVVRLVALGTSKHAAGYGSHALELLAGLPATVLAAPGAGVGLPAPRPDEPLIVLSQSGRTPALLDVARRAAEAGVGVIAITNEAASLLEEVADVTLACHAGAERVVAATKSVTAQMLLLRALAAPVEAHALDPLVRCVRDVLKLDVTPVVRGDPPSGVVCAGFAAEWIADEIALKFEEMAGRPATSEAVIEHFHGPRATGMRVLAFLDPSDPNSIELARDRDRVATVGPGFDLDLPVTGDGSLDAIVRLVAGQRIVHAWALALGEDPDADRGLSKVTATR